MRKANEGTQDPKARATPTNSKSNEQVEKLVLMLSGVAYTAFDNNNPKLFYEIAKEEITKTLQQTALKARLDSLAYALHFTAHMSRKDAHQAILDEITDLKAKQERE